MTSSSNEDRWIKEVSLKKKQPKTNLPPHENVVAVFQGVVVKVIRVEAFGIFVKRLKLTLERNKGGGLVTYLRF